MRKLMVLATGAALSLSTAPAIAQQQNGLVNVNVSDIQVDLNRVISENNINVQAPIGAVVQVPIGIAANVCNVSAAVLARQDADAAPCEATSATTTEAELMALARSLQRQ